MQREEGRKRGRERDREGEEDTLEHTFKWDDSIKSLPQLPRAQRSLQKSRQNDCMSQRGWKTPDEQGITIYKNTRYKPQNQG